MGWDWTGSREIIDQDHTTAVWVTSRQQHQDCLNLSEELRSLFGNAKWLASAGWF